MYFLIGKVLSGLEDFIINDRLQELLEEINDVLHRPKLSLKIENMIKAYENDVHDPKGLGSFEVLNLLTNRDVLEEHRNELTTLQSARLLFADEKLMSNRDMVIAECGGKAEFAKLRQHNPVQSAWWWFLDQIPVEQI